MDFTIFNCDIQQDMCMHGFPVAILVLTLKSCVKEFKKMPAKELRKMNRGELIDIIYALQEKEHKLQEENDKLQHQLREQDIKIAEAGSIAEAVVGLSGIFEIAQATADQYLDAVRAASVERDAHAIRMLKDAPQQDDTILEKTPAQSVALQTETENAVQGQWTSFEEKSTGTTGMK